MKNVIIIIVFLSCVSLAVADTGIQFFSFATTNAETGAVLTTETFTRGGQTNLVRVTKTQNGTVVFQSQQFCHHGEPVAWFSFRDGIQSFSTKPNTPYSVELEFLPSKDVRCAIIWGRDFIDGFYPTNGIYYPVPDADLEFKDFKR